MEKDLYFYDFDSTWRKLLKYARSKNTSNFFHGAFVGYDDSPRRGKNRARIVTGGTPEKFCNYLRQIIEISESQGKDFLFLTAWNEWSEGAYLEPDALNGFKYLEAIKTAVNK